MSSTDEKKPVIIHLSYGVHVAKITTDTLQPLSSVKERAKKSWQVPREQQRLYSDGKELTGDSKTLWNVALENVTAKGKPSVLKTLDKIKNWQITLETVPVKTEASKVENHAVSIHLHYGTNMIEVKTDDSHLLSSVKKKAEATWGVLMEQQHLFSEGKELIGDKKTLWQVAMDAVAPTEKQSVPKTMEKIKNWKITLKIAKELEFKAIEAKDIPNNKRIPWEMQKVLQALNEKRKVTFILASEERISEDNVDTSTMVLCAKNYQWTQVFEILERKPYIVNAIPQERAWSALHQAVFANDSEAIRKLLAMNACDPEIKAKRDWSNQGKAGMTPYELAEKHGYSCQSLFLDHKKLDAESLEVTFIPVTQGQSFLKVSIPYFDLASSFLKRDILVSLNLEDGSFLHITERMYSLLEKDWQYVQSTVRECLYPFDKMIADELQNAKSSYELKKAMIWIYTCNRVYRQVNAALRRASETQFPVSDDLLLSLYSLFLTSILLHWKDLKRIQETTYRGLGLSSDQAKLYRKDTTFHWLPFTSSTRVESEAKKFTLSESGASKALFVIDNSSNSLWSPRDIVPYSINSPDFLEVVHPPCARFCITGVKKMSGYTKYNIQLLHPDK